MCIRQGLKIVIKIYRKFVHLPEFIDDFSKVLYDELISDQLPYFKDQYVGDKAKLIEIVTTSWSSEASTAKNYLSFPKVMPAVMSML